MSSPGHRRGLCGHIMAGYGKHKVCAQYRDKKKGEDNCVKNLPCLNCDVLTEEQKLKLATPQYQKKKEKREAKAVEESSSTLVDPSTVSVIGLVKDNETVSSEEMSTTPAGAKIKKISKGSEAVSSTPEVAKTKKDDKTPDSRVAKEKSAKKRHSSPGSTSAASTDSKLEAMDLKWAEHFSRLEALFFSKSLTQPAPTFQSVKITPAKPPPAGALDNSEPFFALARSTDQPASSQQKTSDKPQPVNRPSTTDQPTTDSVVNPQLLHPVWNRLTILQIQTWTLTLILMPGPPLCLLAILRRVNSLTLTRRSHLLKQSKRCWKNRTIGKP